MGGGRVSFWGEGDRDLVGQWQGPRRGEKKKFVIGATVGSFLHQAGREEATSHRGGRGRG